MSCRSVGCVGAVKSTRLYRSPSAVDRMTSVAPCTASAVRPGTLANGAANVSPPSRLSANARLTPSAVWVLSRAAA